VKQRFFWLKFLLKIVFENFASIQHIFCDIFSLVDYNVDEGEELKTFFSTISRNSNRSSVTI